MRLFSLGLVSQGLLLAAAFAAAGCQSQPYCLNCGGDGFFRPLDLSEPPDLSLSDGSELPDLTGAGDGGCAPTNGGVERCDGLDNDCNGTIDDVSPDKLVGDPNNCGACGNQCEFPMLNQFGACVGGGDMGGTPTCQPTTCFPGFKDIDMNVAGCEYACQETNNGVEICDGKDNDCNGSVDDPFTATWLDAAKQTPAYNSDLANCGGCGAACSRPGAVAACKTNGTTGLGFCGTSHCINDGADTYRHNPAAGDKDVTGCEYHCAFASTTVTTGTQDCDSVACSFPAEVCDSLDNDCDFVVDDNPIDVNVPCTDPCPGGNCRGQCMPGTLICSQGVKQCMGGQGPGVEACDGIDNDCNGLVDDPFTTTYFDGANQMPKYDGSLAHCGGCGQGCNLANAVNTCAIDLALQPSGRGVCKVLACNAGFNYAPRTSCGGTPGPRDGMGGVGCYYACPVNPQAPESCDGQDNDCSGCVDDGLTPPANFCATQGVCSGPPVPVVCQGANGWKCNYSGKPNVNLDANGNLAVVETRCDGLDNNCNGVCDFDGFPTLGQACSQGSGVCRVDGFIKCDPGFMAANCRTGPQPTAACGTHTGGNAVAPNLAARANEICDGRDNDCDGETDERTNTTIGATTYTGWRDPMVAVPRPGGGTVYVYAYEASRTTAEAATPGSGATRACAKSNVLPWANVTQAEAQAACARVRDSANQPMRLCSEGEWQNACAGPAPVPGSNTYSFSQTRNTYAANLCNDANRTGGGAVWRTGFVTSQATAANKFCYTDWAGGNRVHDLSGNLFEWTSTQVNVLGNAYFRVRGGSYTSPADGVPPDGVSCQFDFAILPPDYVNADVGFRCCADNPP